LTLKPAVTEGPRRATFDAGAKGSSRTVHSKSASFGAFDPRSRDRPNWRSSVIGAAGFPWGCFAQSRGQNEIHGFDFAGLSSHAGGGDLDKTSLSRRLSCIPILCRWLGLRPRLQTSRGKRCPEALKGRAFCSAGCARHRPRGERILRAGRRQGCPDRHVLVQI
jgi:hypothetical protein